MRSRRRGSANRSPAPGTTRRLRTGARRCSSRTCQHRSPWSVPSTFTQNAPDSRMSCHRSEVTCGRNPTSGGSRDTDVNEPIVNPIGSPSSDPGDHGDAGREVAEHGAVLQGVDRHRARLYAAGPDRVPGEGRRVRTCGVHESATAAAEQKAALRRRMRLLRGPDRRSGAAQRRAVGAGRSAGAVRERRPS